MTKITIPPPSSPIFIFHSTTINGITIPQKHRLSLLYGSSNWHWFSGLQHQRPLMTYLAAASSFFLGKRGSFGKGKAFDPLRVLSPRFKQARKFVDLRICHIICHVSFSREETKNQSNRHPNDGNRGSNFGAGRSGLPRRGAVEVERVVRENRIRRRRRRKQPVRRRIEADRAAVWWRRRGVRV